MSEERLDYAILISLAMREEADVMASALRAEGIDAFVSAIRYDWHLALAFGGAQVFVPWERVDEAKDIIRGRMREAAANPEGEAVQRRDRWKLWALILAVFGSHALIMVLESWWWQPEDKYHPLEWISGVTAW